MAAAKKTEKAKAQAEAEAKAQAEAQAPVKRRNLTREAIASFRGDSVAANMVKD